MAFLSKLNKIQLANPAKSLNRKLGASATEYIAATGSGNSPQTLVNELAERIAAGSLRSAIVCGCEALATFSRAVKQGQEPLWGDDIAEQPLPLPAYGAVDYPISAKEAAQEVKSYLKHELMLVERAKAD